MEEKNEDLILTKEEWANWKTHPVTSKVYKYLHDFRIQIAENIAEGIAAGSVIDPDHIEKDTLRCEALIFVEVTDEEDINNFYLEKEEGKDASKQ